MNSYFKPPGRKIGVVTLVLACLFAAGWVRSLSTADKAAIPISQTASIEFLSMRCDFCLTMFSRPQRLEWKSSPTNDATDHPMNLLTANWSVKFCGLRLFTDLHAYGDKTAGILVPYWMPVIPLTLLSAWLLLSKLKQPNSSRESDA